MILVAKVALAFAGTVAEPEPTRFTTASRKSRWTTTKARTSTSGRLRQSSRWRCMLLRWLCISPQRHEIHKFPREAQQAIPILRVLAKELENYPNTEFVEVRDSDTHVVVRTVGKKVVVDVVDPENKVHVVCPLAMIQDVASALNDMKIESDDSDSDSDAGPTA